MNSRTVVAFLAALTIIVCAYVQTPDPRTHRWIVTGDFYGAPFDPAFSIQRTALLTANGCSNPSAPGRTIPPNDISVLALSRVTDIFVDAVESRLGELAHRDTHAALQLAERQLPENALNSLLILKRAANLLEKQFDSDELNRQPSPHHLAA
jgi:hypothetical protein